ncbi:MAG: hypothetical protein V8T85_16255 [Blautia faecicola]
MKKSGKGLKITIGIVYVLIAVAWLIWSLTWFSFINYNFASIYSVIYFIPWLVMFTIIGAGIYRLIKDKDKVLDTIVMVAFMVLMIVIANIVNANAVIDFENGNFDVTVTGMIFRVYSQASILTVIGGVLAVILAAIRNKKRKG